MRKTSSVTTSIQQRLHKPHKPPTHLRRISVATQPPSQHESIQSAITNLNTTDDWNSLHQRILSLPSESLIKISRQFDTSNKALKFFHFIHDNTSSISISPLPSIFQTVIELAIREQDECMSIVELYNLSKELKVSLMPNSAIIIIRYFSRVKKIRDCVLVYDGLDPDVKNVNVKNTLLDVLLKSDRFDDARQLLDEMLKPDAKFPVNEATLNIVFPVLLRWNWEM